MRKWGIVVTLAYLVIVVAILIPAASLLAEVPASQEVFLNGLRETLSIWGVWFFIGVLVGSQALLLFLSVDTSQKRLKPRSHVAISATVAGILIALLFASVVLSLGLALGGEKFWDGWKDADILKFWGGFWVLWGAIFFAYLRNSSEPLTRAVSWLITGSVLELLIVVPCHIIVRRRHDCSAPAVTSFGIVTGIAIMLLAFGPSVMFLYKKQLDTYGARKTA